MRFNSCTHRFVWPLVIGLLLASSARAQFADFPAPTAGTEGKLPRNIYRNPGLVQVDASVLKNNHLPWLGEQGNLQFRFDFLNLFNHVNLGSVDNNLADATFGRVTSALSPRQIQLGLRISF